MAVLLVAQSVVVPLDFGRRVAGTPAISEVRKQDAPGLSGGAAVLFFPCFLADWTYWRAPLCFAR